MADNFHFDMTGVALEKALDVAFSHHNKAIGWAEQDCDDRSDEAVWGANRSKKRLVFFWSEHADMAPFPAPMEAEGLAPFIKAWLAAADYGPAPDHDGDNGKGCRVYNQSWGHIGGLWQAFVAVEPVWLLYGK